MKITVDSCSFFASSDSSLNILFATFESSFAYSLIPWHIEIKTTSPPKVFVIYSHKAESENFLKKEILRKEWKSIAGQY